MLSIMPSAESRDLSLQDHLNSVHFDRGIARQWRRASVTRIATMILIEVADHTVQMEDCKEWGSQKATNVRSCRYPTRMIKIVG
jgi:protein associated with RNAse G/E